MYNTDSKKIGFVLSFMTSGNAAKWQIMTRRAHRRRALDNTQLPINWKDFATDLRDEFTLIDDKGKAGTNLMTIKQGDQLVEAYIADFKIIVSRFNIMEDAVLI